MMARRAELASLGLTFVLSGSCLQKTVRRCQHEAVHIACFEINAQLFEFAELRIRVQGDLRANQKPGEFCSADSLDGIAKGAFAPGAAVMPLFESLELHGEKKPRDRPKLMNAAPQKSAVGPNKDVPVCVHDSPREPADLRMQKRLSAADPNNRSGTAPHGVQANVGGKQVQIRDARRRRVIAKSRRQSGASGRGKVQNQAMAGRASQSLRSEADR